MQTEIDEFPDSLSTEASSNMRARAQRVKWMLGYVHKHGKNHKRKVLIARFATEHAVSRETANEYLSQLIDGEYVFCHNEHVLGGEDYEAALKKELDKD